MSALPPPALPVPPRPRRRWEGRWSQWVPLLIIAGVLVLVLWLLSFVPPGVLVGETQTVRTFGGDGAQVRMTVTSVERGDAEAIAASARLLDPVGDGTPYLVEYTLDRDDAGEPLTDPGGFSWMNWRVEQANGDRGRASGWVNDGTVCANLDETNIAELAATGETTACLLVIVDDGAPPATLSLQVARQGTWRSGLTQYRTWRTS